MVFQVQVHFARAHGPLLTAAARAAAADAVAAAAAVAIALVALSLPLAVLRLELRHFVQMGLALRKHHLTRQM